MAQGDITIAGFNTGHFTTNAAGTSVSMTIAGHILNGVRDPHTGRIPVGSITTVVDGKVHHVTEGSAAQVSMLEGFLPHIEASITAAVEKAGPQAALPTHKAPAAGDDPHGKKPRNAHETKPPSDETRAGPSDGKPTDGKVKKAAVESPDGKEEDGTRSCTEQRHGHPAAIAANPTDSTPANQLEGSYRRISGGRGGGTELWDGPLPEVDAHGNVVHREPPHAAKGGHDRKGHSHADHHHAGHHTKVGGPDHTHPRRKGAMPTHEERRRRDHRGQIASQPPKAPLHPEAGNGASELPFVSSFTAPLVVAAAVNPALAALAPLAAVAVTADLTVQGGIAARDAIMSKLTPKGP